MYLNDLFSLYIVNEGVYQLIVIYNSIYYLSLISHYYDICTMKILKVHTNKYLMVVFYI